MRVPMIAGNWKMNTTLKEAVELVEVMRDELDEITNVDKVICPPSIFLTAVREVIRGSSIKLGAQNMYFLEKGAYTGEISPPMLVDICEYVITGHSERRQYFDEDGDIINKKIVSALKFGIKPILCIGEKLEENESGETEETLNRQLQSALIEVNDISNLVIAYEPIWAIGTGKAASAEQANTTISRIRSYIARLYEEKISQTVPILYGGSTNAKNIAEFIKQSEIDGALVGGASLKPEIFISMIKQTAEIRRQ